MSANKRLVIIAPYPKGQAPSQRFRFEQYLEHFEELGYTVEFHSFLSNGTWNALYNEGSFFKKAFGLLGSFFRRFGLMFKLRSADKIFIHREASMIGPPIFEWFISKVLRKEFIYDFDDAIWLPNYSDSNARFHRLKAYKKVNKIMKWAHVISAGNHFLKDYALKHNANVKVIPTTVDTENVHNLTANQSTSPIIIGWTGTHTTMSYLEPIVPIIQELEKDYQIRFRIISNQKPEIELKSLEFVKWNKESEIEDLAQFNIGIMPLTESTWSKGKCGFKAIQYMALGIPTILSPIGANNDIVEHRENGFLVNTADEWKATLISLIESEELRREIGNHGKNRIQSHYSTKSQLSHYTELLNS